MRAHNSLLSRIRILTVVATTSAVLTKSSVLFVQRRNVNTQSVNVDFVLGAERDNTHIVLNYFVSSTSVLVIVPRARSRTRQHVTQEVVGSPTDSTRRRSWQLTVDLRVAAKFRARFRTNSRWTLVDFRVPQGSFDV